MTRATKVLRVITAYLPVTKALAQTGAPAARGTVSPTAQTVTPLAQGTVSSAQPSIQQHNCVVKTLSSCKANGGCASLDTLKGQKIPVKLTIDLATRIIGGVDSDGWIDATSIEAVSRAGDEIIVQGFDDDGLWQVLINEKKENVSLSLATSDETKVGFGQCTAVKQ
jgi:hypothetical protein